MLLNPELAVDFLNKYKAVLSWINAGKSPETIEEFADLRSQLYLDPDHISQISHSIPKVVDDDFIRAVKQAVYGEFIYLKKEKCGYIFQKADTAVFYQTAAITSPLEDMIDDYSMVETALLPFANQLVCDGLIASKRIVLGRNMIKAIREAYKDAKKKGTVVVVAG